MFELIKSVVWVAAALLVAYYAMGFLGYEVNSEYFTYSKNQCEQKLKDCTQKLSGSDSLKNCDFKCVDPKLIIKKK